MVSVCCEARCQVSNFRAVLCSEERGGKLGKFFGGAAQIRAATSAGSLFDNVNPTWESLRVDYSGYASTMYYTESVRKKKGCFNRF
jgi:hypothetical protein